ncbi:class I SAM-dependent methyltransferase [Usitatibacter rugosus]|nr:class I SAM-dependent methyltransferase [Usitatibacter rugosus]
MAQVAPVRRPYAWQSCLDVEGQDVGHYLDYVNQPLLGIISGEPRRVLELGCAGGRFGQELKLRYPGATVVGIEAGRAAAALAATRIDRVICSRIEDIDFAAEGLKEGEFDTLVAADVFEHLVNPWDALVRARTLLAPGAQLVASIPNARNLMVVEALVCAGRYPYAERGLLDITHLRFFTLIEIVRMFEETGFRVEGHASTVSPPLVAWHREHRGRAPAKVDVGRMSLSNVTSAEIDELCAEVFLVRARRAESA